MTPLPSATCSHHAYVLPTTRANCGYTRSVTADGSLDVQVWPTLSALGEEYAFAITLVDARIGSSCSSICDSTLAVAQSVYHSVDNRYSRGWDRTGELLTLVYHEVVACVPWMIAIVGDRYGHRPRCHPRWIR